MSKVRRPSVDEARLRPHLRTRSGPGPAAAARGPDSPSRVSSSESDSPSGKVPTGDEWERLRGLPMVGVRGVPGTQPGTDPEQELLRKQR